MGSICIENKEMREVVVAVLTGDVVKMRSLIEANGYSPIKLARWSGDRRGVSDEGDIDSFQLSCAMIDALKYNELFDKLNVGKMWGLHHELFPNIKRTSYDQFGFIIWNWMEEPGDNPYFDENEEQELVKTGVRIEDIQLTNAGIQHMEKELVSLLKAGASPYFLVTIPDYTEAYIDKNGTLRHTYFDVAPMLEVTKVHSCDYWWEYIGDSLENDISSSSVSTLESIIEGLFNVGACERILHLTDEYICEQARHEGELLMLEHLGEIHSIIK